LREENKKSFRTNALIEFSTTVGDRGVDFVLARGFYAIFFAYRLSKAYELKKKEVMEEFEVPAPAVLRSKIELNFKGIGFAEERKRIKMESGLKMEAAKSAKHGHAMAYQKSESSKSGVIVMVSMRTIREEAQKQEERLHDQIRGHVMKRTEARRTY